MEEKKVPLTFRVMRLGSQVPSRRPPTSMLSSRVGSPADSKLMWEGEGVTCGIGTITTLPSSFGNVYVGEELRACVNLYNSKETDVVLVRYKVDLELPDGKLTALYETMVEADDVIILKSETWIEQVISVPLVRLGAHGIVCYAVYTDYRGETKHVKMVFRFNVAAPLKVVVGRIELPEAQGDAQDRTFLLDFRLTNMMPNPIHLLSATLTPKEGFEVQDLNRKESDVAVEGEDDQLFTITDASTHTGDVVSYMFLVKDLRMETLVQSTTNKIVAGSLSVSWQAAGGEAGQIDDIIAEVEVPQPQADVVIRLVAVPSKIEAQRPFVTQFTVRNNTDHPVRLYLQIRRDMVGEVVPTGGSGKSLGEIEASSFKNVFVNLLALSPGTHRVTGVRVIDIDSRHAYLAEPIEIVAV